ncbi:Molybdenum transport system permease protein modB [Vibrio nigripulchritudo SFn27]|uniref:Molybdenum transport system permease n=1 Tax=Vibrio nigripulchritudo TaxID=28173 RepID=U4KIM2_9VIBR|nr:MULTISPECIES: molybdate ABC transporter permease subunit [Vibrio]UAB72418.1 molybdate ABC transporter permease subunit [Vibrio sp. SCSIO 43132]CCN81530.1 Molybdenum transport system permease protein modB [Vibrio nigripulchritudo BLFn1]CCN91627.1 Molybdenum transport system permease protein modB [Vibrio nigripulchritudo SFn27]CCN96511.1 Molybdenum transport system permease protein modB [Vibrio nigripulchritudo ENn2]CCO38385.1 Molybdenum transport system permease protein modB [Vibrio nigripul
MLTDFELEALVLSLKVAIYAVVWLTPFGVGIAWLLARKHFFGKSVVDACIHLPLVLPPVVIGYLLLVVMGKQGVVGSWLNETFGIVFSFNWKGAVLASAVVSLPLMVRAIRLNLESIDRKLELAARTLGASPIKVFFTITLPLILPGIITGMMLAFARSLGEFGATISFVSSIPGETQTLPLAMYSFIETPGMEYEAARLCVISIVVALGSLLISEALTRSANRKIGNAGRANR